MTILDRPRHDELMRRVREAGARIKLISDGDVAGAVMAATEEHTGVDMLMGIGGAPEAVIAASENEDRLGAKVVGEGIGGLRGAVGTPEQLREYLQRYEECGVDQVIFCYQAGKNRHEHIMEALELFGREVLPEFKERDDKLTRDKEQRLAPIIDEVMARKPAEDHPPLPTEDYSFPAIPRAMADRFGNDEFHQMLDEFAEQSAIGPGGIENLINNR